MNEENEANPSPAPRDDALRGRLLEELPADGDQPMATDLPNDGALLGRGRLLMGSITFGPRMAADTSGLPAALQAYGLGVVSLQVCSRKELLRHCALLSDGDLKDLVTDAARMYLARKGTSQGLPDLNLSLGDI